MMGESLTHKSILWISRILSSPSLTSNIGNRYLQEGVTVDEITKSVHESNFTELRKAMQPEFLNRIDDTVLFKPLTLAGVRNIVDLCIVELRKRMKDRRITIELDREARDGVAERSYDPVYGVRRCVDSCRNGSKTNLLARL